MKTMIRRGLTLCLAIGLAEEREEQGVGVGCASGKREKQEEGKGRNPKSEIRKKPEARNPNGQAAPISPVFPILPEVRRFGFRISGFFRISDFGFRICLHFCP